VPFVAIVAGVLIGQWQVRKTIRVQTDQVATANKVEAVRIVGKILSRYADALHIDDRQDRLEHMRGIADELGVLFALAGRKNAAVVNWLSLQIGVVKAFLESDRSDWTSDHGRGYVLRIGLISQRFAEWASGDKDTGWFETDGRWEAIKPVSDAEWGEMQAKLGADASS